METEQITVWILRNVTTTIKSISRGSQVENLKVILSIYNSFQFPEKITATSATPQLMIRKTENSVPYQQKTHSLSEILIRQAFRLLP
jgi:hypothetical protein